jgi:competence protein ComGC
MPESEVQENGVTRSMLLITVLLSSLALLLTIPNIYLDNQIYYESREIAQLHKVKIILEEEQLLIKNRLEEVNVKENLR